MQECPEKYAKYFINGLLFFFFSFFFFLFLGKQTEEDEYK